MAARQRATKPRPLEAALVRLQALAARGVRPSRMAREVEIIVAEWRAEEADRSALIKARLDDLHEQLASGVVDAEEQVSYVDRDEAGAVKQASLTLAALVATRDAVDEARRGL